MALNSSECTVENTFGRMETLPAGDVPALLWGTWTFRWSLGIDVKLGGGMEMVLFTRFPTNRWSLPQTADPTAPGYVTARCAADAALSLNVVRWPLLHNPMSERHVVIPSWS